MIIVRSAKSSDFEGIAVCAHRAGIGMSLPKDDDLLKKRLEHAEASFQKKVSTPGNEFYLFVLEDTETKQIGGTCAILATIGKEAPFFTFHVDLASGILTFHQYEERTSEICSLYLLPEFRKGGLGKLLSLSRFHFIAAFPERFQKKLMANMRGVVDSQSSPFWDSIGRNFANCSYECAMTKRIEDEKVMQDLFPVKTIPIPSLPLSAREVIGEVHPHTRPAIKMLLMQGFQKTDEIDPLDGGPILLGERSAIHGVKESHASSVATIIDTEEENHSFLISNNCRNFRVCFGELTLQKDGRVAISKEVAEALQIQVGQSIRYLPLSE